jgi:hypothetical protein
MDTGAMMETDALADDPEFGTALFVTHWPAQPVTAELNVIVAGWSQELILPTFQVTVFPDMDADPLLGLPTSTGLFIQVGTVSVTVTFCGERLDTKKFLNAT